MSKQQSQHKHSRVIFNPLTVSCKLIVVSSNVPAAQEYDAFEKEFIPDRTITPTKVLPMVIATDPDGISESRRVNRLLSIDTDRMVWTVNNKPISQVWTEGIDYSIETEDSDSRGTLYVFRNISSWEGAFELCFNGVFVDWRNGKTIEIQSDTIEMHTSDKMQSEINIVLSPNHIIYDPRYDNRLLYDYLSGFNVTGIDNLLNIEPGKHYIQQVDVVMTQGTDAVDILSKGYTVRVTRKGSSQALVPGSSDAPELVSISSSSVVFDARQIDDCTYTISIMDSDTSLISGDIVIRSNTTMPGQLSSPKFAARIPRSMKRYHNEAAIVADTGNPIPYPELYYMLRWYTARVTHQSGTSGYLEPVMHMIGETLDINIENIGLGNTESESMFDVWFEIESHDKMLRLVDEDGNALTDGTNKLIATV